MGSVIESPEAFIVDNVTKTALFSSFGPVGASQQSEGS